MFCSVLKNVSKVFSFSSGNRDRFKSFTASSNHAYSRSAGGLYVIDPTMIVNVTKAFGRLFLHLKAPKKASKTISKSVNDSEEGIDVFHSILMDEGFYSASTSKQFENTVSKLELCYDQLRSEFELKPCNKFGVHELTEDEEEENFKGKGGKRIVKGLEERVDEDYEKYFKGFINETFYFEECLNELTELTDDDEEEYCKGKGKGGKMLVKKTCHLEEEHVNKLIDDDGYGECFKEKGKSWKRFLKRTSHSKEKEQDFGLKEQYLNKIKTSKNYLGFQELDEETQLMICKIDSLRGSGKDDSIDTLLRMVEAKSLELQRYQKTVEKMKEVEADYTKTIDDILDEHQRILREKNQEIANLNKKLQAEKRSRGLEGESSKKHNKGFLGNMRIKDLDDEYQTLIANIEALRKSDSVSCNKVLDKLGELSNIK